MPTLTFNINGNAFTLPASAYTRQVSSSGTAANFHDLGSSLFGRNGLGCEVKSNMTKTSDPLLTRSTLCVLYSLITTAAAPVSAGAARACGSWVMCSLGSTTPSSTGQTTLWVWPRLCKITEHQLTFICCRSTILKMSVIKWCSSNNIIKWLVLVHTLYVSLIHLLQNSLVALLTPFQISTTFQSFFFL